MWLYVAHSVRTWCFRRVTGPGPDERGRQDEQELFTLLVTASVYKRPQTAAAPTLSSPCLRHKSVNKEGKSTQLIIQHEKLCDI